MNKLTLKALRGSIKKWKEIVDGTGVDNGTADCPLCIRFYNRHSNEMRLCTGCPVSSHTGNFGCIGTPYNDFRTAAPGSEYPYVANTPEAKRHARRMLAFLKRLLP